MAINRNVILCETNTVTHTHKTLIANNLITKAYVSENFFSLRTASILMNFGYDPSQSEFQMTCYTLNTAGDSVFVTLPYRYRSASKYLILGDGNDTVWVQDANTNLPATTSNNSVATTGWVQKVGLSSNVNHAGRITIFSDQNSDYLNAVNQGYANTPYTCPASGFIWMYFRRTGDGATDVYMKINEIEYFIARPGEYYVNSSSSVIMPVRKGDVIYWKRNSNLNALCQAYLIPFA